MRKNRILVGLIGIVLIAAIMVITPAAAKTWYVPDDGTIEGVVGLAGDGDTVFIRSGYYHYAGGDDGVLPIDVPNLTLQGEGADIVTLDFEDISGSYISIHSGASGTVIEGIKIVKATKGLEVGAPDCIIRNCVFEGPAGDHGVQLFGDNCTFENNVVSNSATFGALEPSANSVIINNTFIDNTGPAILLTTLLGYDNVNNIITRNNFSNNGKGIWVLYTADTQGSGNKIYLNNFVDNIANVAYNGDFGCVLSSAIYWNSTEQIEYVYGGTSYTNYMGNYWGSDYTGTDADGDGIGDTAYDIPGSATDKDYRPLMAPFESYSGEAATPPEAKYYLVPENSSAAGYCNTTEVMLMLNTTVPVQSGKIDLLYSDWCANVTSYEPDAAYFEDQTPVLVPGRLTVGFAHWAGAVPTNQPAGVYHLGNFTVHCCNETVPCCETDLTFDDVGLWDETGATPSFVTENGTFECVAPPEEPDLVIVDKTEDWVSLADKTYNCLLYTSPSPRDRTRSRMPSSA